MDAALVRLFPVMVMDGPTMLVVKVEMEFSPFRVASCLLFVMVRVSGGHVRPANEPMLVNAVFTTCNSFVLVRA